MESLLEGQGLASSSGPGGCVLWLSLALGYFFVARSDEIFASPAGSVHPVHCLTRRDVALYKGERRLTSLRWHQATSIKVRFCGHKGDQACDEMRLSVEFVTVGFLGICRQYCWD